MCSKHWTIQNWTSGRRLRAVGKQGLPLRVRRAWQRPGAPPTRRRETPGGPGAGAGCHGPPKNPEQPQPRHRSPLSLRCRSSSATKRTRWQKLSPKRVWKPRRRSWEFLHHLLDERQGRTRRQSIGTKLLKHPRIALKVIFTVEVEATVAVLDVDKVRCRVLREGEQHEPTVHRCVRTDVVGQDLDTNVWSLSDL